MFAVKNHCIATGSGTDALHLAYILAGLKKGDEVIAPVYTCTATNIPFLYMGVNIKFADIDIETMNISVDSVKKLLTKKTKAIICMHYGGLPCALDERQVLANKYKIPLIEDAAHAIGATYKKKSIGSISDFTMFSFQAIKHITTGDGGMLCLKNKKLIEKAKRIRWFGISREDKQKGIWENDIVETGYKYQMTDISAAIGLAGLEEFDGVLKKRQKLFSIYNQELSLFSDVKIVGVNNNDRTHASWLFTVLVEKRLDLQKKLLDVGIESNQMHFRNDRYTIFKEFWEGESFPNMDMIDDNYLVLPLHHKMSEEDVLRVCSELKRGW